MNIATDAPKRPALRYYGGKWNLAPWIISHFPPHKNYVEPCGGAASVLLQKPRSPLETYNDLDGNVVNFFRVLRDQPDELIRKIRLTPWAREEYEISLNPCDEPIERARLFFVALWMSIGQALTCTAGQFRSVTNPYGTPKTGMRLQSDELFLIADRLMGVQIENKDYGYVINRYDNEDALIYFDPPYVTDTRTQTDVYQFEWNDEEHEIASMQLKQCAAYIIVSGYACPLYTDLYESHGWHRVDKESQTNSGGKRIESLWLSPRTWNALQNDYSDLGLFAST
jgi:DNA adenine methylase